MVSDGGSRGDPIGRLEHPNRDDPSAAYGGHCSVPAATGDGGGGPGGLLEPGAGFVRPELAVRHAIEDALCHGAGVRERTRVTGISAAGGNDDDDAVRYTAAAYRARGELEPYLRVTSQVRA